MPFVLGLVGERGAGKSTVQRIINRLLERDGLAVRWGKSSDLLGETLDLWRIERTTENLQALGRAMRDAFGIAAIPNAMSHRLLSIGGDVIIWDGIRWTGDEDLIRQMAPSALIYVTAPAALRYERVKSRCEKVEERNSGIQTMREFLLVEEQENERQIPEIGARADVKIENTSSDESELERKVRAALGGLALTMPN